MAGIDMQKCDCTARCGDDPGIKTGKVTPCRHYRALSAPEGEAAGAGEAVGYVNLEAVRNLKDDSSSCGIVHRPTAYRSTPLYTAAPKASAQALTNDDCMKLLGSSTWHASTFFVREVERAVLAKNGIPAPARMNDDKQEGVA